MRTISIEGPLTHRTVARWSRVLDAVETEGEGLALDMRAVEELDSSGAALLARMKRRFENDGGQIQVSNLNRTVERKLALFPFLRELPEAPSGTQSLVEGMLSTAQLGREMGRRLVLLLADASWFLVEGLLRRRIPWSTVFYEMSSMGSKAVGVVALIAFLVGATMGLQSAEQLRQFGANIFVVDLIGISMTRELGPLMAAIVVAGRSGSSVAAEIGTMVITEEIDALKTMGLHPVRFVVLPKLLALTLTQPLLTVLANAAGIFGGFLVATLYLDVGAVSFLDRLEEALFLKDLFTGLIKSVVFAQLIMAVGALFGFRTKGGADAVGRSTTAAVVAGIFVVIAADAVASLVFYFGD